jgi:hypothetical protein
MTTSSIPEEKDKLLWQIAKKRAGFKRHLAVYVIVNVFLWATWYFTGQGSYHEYLLPWPLWTTVGWGIGLAFHFSGAYVFHGYNSVEREYQKLKDRTTTL